MFLHVNYKPINHAYHIMGLISITYLGGQTLGVARGGEALGVARGGSRDGDTRD